METPKPQHTLTPNIEDKDIYKYTIDTRNFEVSLFWQRSNYFLALNSALAIGFFSSQGSAYKCVLVLLGFIASILWYQVNLGSKYWQSRWEHRLQLVEKEIAPGLDLFSASPDTVEADVRASLQFNDHGKIRKYFDDQILSKPSVSFCMTLLSLAFAFSWVLTGCIYLVTLICKL